MRAILLIEDRPDYSGDYVEIVEAPDVKGLVAKAVSSLGDWDRGTPSLWVLGEDLTQVSEEAFNIRAAERQKITAAKKLAERLRRLSEEASALRTKVTALESGEELSTARDRLQRLEAEIGAEGSFGGGKP